MIKTAPRQRYKRPLEIIKVMQSGTPQQQAAGRRIMVERYGFRDQDIDLLLSRGAATGRAPIAASRFALNVMSQQLPALRTAAPKADALDWFIRGGRYFEPQS